jgi:trehalose 6-phosphate synthase
MSDLVIASNRGPVQFELDDEGNLLTARGSGGMVAALGPALAGEGGTWVAAAITEGDRVAAKKAGRGGRREIELPLGPVTLRSVVTDQRKYSAYYNRVSNRTLWFLQHYLFDVARHPVFDRSFRDAWLAYTDVNVTFAEAIEAEASPGGSVFVQDYHLSLAPGMLRERRPDLAIGFFLHCPWANPGYFSMLPTRIMEELLAGMLGADLVGFLVPRWANNFMRCCAEVGYDVDMERCEVLADDGRRVPVRSYPLGVDPDELRRRVAQPDVQTQKRVLRDWARNRMLIVRVDRMELSKNILRGLEGFRTFLERNPRMRGRVVHFALAYASRRDLPEYQAYSSEVKHVADEINDAFRTKNWEPVRLELRDNYPRALAAMALADILIVNPVWDGMNLVAKEGPSVSENDAVLILSRNAGAADDLRSGAILVNPFDTAELAEAIAAAIQLPRDERGERAKRLLEGAGALPPKDWFQVQRDDLATIAADRRKAPEELPGL